MFNRKRFSVGVAAILMHAWASQGISQVQWTKYANNPVLPHGDPNSFDEITAVATTVMFHEGMYKMWYEGDDGFGYATSSNGITWFKHANNPVLEPGPGTWDEGAINNASVLVINNTYRMWYSGVDGLNENRIGHATSFDGIEWTKDDDPVLNHGEPGTMDDEEVIHPFVMYEDPLYRMWYNGHDGTAQRILYAYSFDGIEWTKFTDYPMLEPGTLGSWTDGGLGPLCVVRAGHLYHMWYTAWNQAMDIQIGYATSPDGLVWTEYTSVNPVLSPGSPDSWDDWGVAVPNVRLEGQEFLMWYGGGDDVLFQTGLATSPYVTSVYEDHNNGPAIQTTPRFVLYQNYPNPFNPQTSIQYHLPEPAIVKISIFDVSGRSVRKLINSEFQSTGRHEIVWDGEDQFGRQVTTGIYFYRFEAGSYHETKRMTLLK